MSSTISPPSLFHATSGRLGKCFWLESFGLTSTPSRDGTDPLRDELTTFSPKTAMSLVTGSPTLMYLCTLTGKAPATPTISLVAGSSRKTAVSVATETQTSKIAIFI